MSSQLDFYTQQSRISDPGRFRDALTDLPAAISDLVRVVQGVTVHVFWAERYGLNLPPDRQAEVQLRTLEKRLARTLELDLRPLVEPRPPERRLVGNCRDFSLLLVALLRHQGIPARARCGFGAYFLPNHYEDHWVAEYWNAAQQRWLLVDAQLDALPWDCWGLINGDDAALTDGDWALLDRLAELTCSDAPEFEAVRHLYETEPGLHVDGEIQSYIDGRAETVRLAV